jgi:hypothetical protein
VVRAGDLCQMRHHDLAGDGLTALAFHVRNYVRVCSRHAYQIDMGYAVAAPVAA